MCRHCYPSELGYEDGRSQQRGEHAASGGKRCIRLCVYAQFHAGSTALLASSCSSRQLEPMYRERRPASSDGHDIQECICTARRWEGAAGDHNTRERMNASLSATGTRPARDALRVGLLCFLIAAAGHRCFGKLRAPHQVAGESMGCDAARGIGS